MNNKDVLDRFVSLEEDTEVTNTATGIIHIKYYFVGFDASG